jgi:hypothetical protein
MEAEKVRQPGAIVSPNVMIFHEIAVLTAALYRAKIHSLG